MEELAVEAEQEKKTAHEIAEALFEYEKRARADGRRYTMSLDTFEQVVREYAEPEWQIESKCALIEELKKELEAADDSDQDAIQKELNAVW